LIDMDTGMRISDEDGGAKLALSVVWPQFLAILLVVFIAVFVGFGWALVGFLTAAMLLAMGAAHLLWRWLLRMQRPNILIGALIGLLAGTLAALLSVGAAYLELVLGKHLGGSMTGAFVAWSGATGWEMFYGTTSANPAAVNVVIAPARMMFGLLGGVLAIMLAVGVVVTALAIPIISGLIGGMFAGARARRMVSGPVPEQVTS